MSTWYKSLILSPEEIKKNLHIQVMARLKPKSITYPKRWVPKTQQDKFVAVNMIKDWPLEKVLKLFPGLNYTFIKGN